MSRIIDWSKIPQLGKIPDRQLARELNVGATTAREARKRLGIAPAPQAGKPAAATTTVATTLEPVKAPKPKKLEKNYRAPIIALRTTPNLKDYQAVVLGLLKERPPEFAKDPWTKDQLHGQVMRSVERLLKRCLAALSMHPSQESLCEDIRAIIRWMDAIANPGEIAATKKESARIATMLDRAVNEQE